MEVKDPFWDVKQGQVLAPDGKPIVGDYDLLGVAPVKSPGSNVSLVPDDVAVRRLERPVGQEVRGGGQQEGPTG